jgi:hypothetical protein
MAYLKAEIRFGFWRHTGLYPAGTTLDMYFGESELQRTGDSLAASRPVQNVDA